MVRFLKFKFLFALKYKISRGISKFGYFNNLQKILIRVIKFQKQNICDGNLMKNEMLIKKYRKIKVLKMYICLNYTSISIIINLKNKPKMA